MVEYELSTIVTMVSQVASALGVCAAATYYIMNLRNAEREKRKQNILMRMPAMNAEFYDRYYYCHYIHREDLSPQERSKVTSSPEYNSNVMFIMHYYNLVGVLYDEGLMSLEEIVKVYSPYQIIGVFEKFWNVIPNNRLNSYGEVVHPGFFVPLEHLYREVKRRYPLIVGMLDSQRDRDERSKRKQENVWSKLSKEEFLASVMK